MKKPLLVGLLLLGMLRVCSGQQAEEKLPFQKLDYTISRADSSIKIDGVLDEPAWSKATVIKILYEYQPGDNVRPPVDTDCLITYDASNLYVAFRANDPDPSKIRAHVLDRDSIDTFIQDDHVGFFIDTFNDERRGFQFRINPLGVQADAFNSELEGTEDWSFDLIWNASGRITAQGYVVEVAVPFNQIRFPKTTGAQTWGVEFFRSWPRSVRHRIVSHYSDRNKSCGECQFNKLTGFEGISPGKNVELDPTLTSHRTDTRVSLEDPHHESDSKVDPGLTARWGITSNMSLIGTLNPDFSQVEADVAQLDVNTRFALFFPEKRPFFLEGNDVFTTPMQAVYSRTVVDPTFGIKLTGKQGANGLGLFVARDNINSLIFPGNQFSDFDSYEQDITSAVLRYKRDLGKSSSIGALYAGREGSDYHNRLYGLDGFLRFSDADTVNYQVIHTDTAYPDRVVLDHNQPADAFGGEGFFAGYIHGGRDWFWLGRYTDRDPEFRADSGFIPRVDIRTLEGNVHRNFWGDSARWFTFIDAGLRAVHTGNHHGDQTDQTLDFYMDYNGPLQSTGFFDFLRENTLFNGVTYDLNHEIGFFKFQPNGSVVLSIFEEFGDAIDFDNSRPARIRNLNPVMAYKIGSNVETSLDHNYLSLFVDGGKLFTANLTQGRVVYHFNVRTFVRAILQYTQVSRDPGLYTFPVDSKSKHLFSQFLFSYKLNPQTVILAGYSDNYIGFQDLSPRSVSLTQTNRTFFLKIGYAWIL